LPCHDGTANCLRQRDHALGETRSQYLPSTSLTALGTK